MQNIAKRLPNDIIYVEKVGNQTEVSMRQLYDVIRELAKTLRAEGKPVLILSNARNEGKMDLGARKLAVQIGKQLDYDKSATYEASAYLHSLRNIMIKATQLNTKVANFRTREEAETWLLRK